MLKRVTCWQCAEAATSLSVTPILNFKDFFAFDCRKNPNYVPSKADLGLGHLIVKSVECCPWQTRQVQASIPKFDENSPGEPGVSTIDDELAVMLLACNAFAAVFILRSPGCFWLGLPAVKMFMPSVYLCVRLRQDVFTGVGTLEPTHSFAWLGRLRCFWFFPTLQVFFTLWGLMPQVSSLRVQPDVAPHGSPKRKKERKNERQPKRESQREKVKERKNEKKERKKARKEGRKERTNERTNEWTHQRTNERTNERINERTNAMTYSY